MGLFGGWVGKQIDKVDKKVQKVAPIYGMARNALKKPGEGPAAQEDPRQAALRQKMTADAESFRKNIQGFKDEQFSPELQEANMAEREGLTNVDRSTNRRGLLYSGINELGRADVGTQKALTVSQAKQDINSLAQKLAEQKDLAASSVGLENFQDVLNQQDKLNQEAAAKRAERQSQYQQIGQGLGYGVGAYQATQKPRLNVGTGAGTGLITQNYNPTTYGSLA